MQCLRRYLLTYQTNEYVSLYLRLLYLSMTFTYLQRKNAFDGNELTCTLTCLRQCKHIVTIVTIDISEK